MSVATLWLPILLCAVLVFVASSLIHMVIRWHVSEYRKLANEDAVRDVMRAGSPTPGMYFIPWCPDHKEMKKPEVLKKFEEGPIAMVTVRANGLPKMGGALGGWFVYTLIVAALATYVACTGLAPGAAFGSVFCVVGLVSFMTFGGGSVQNGIWMGKPWSTVSKELLDAAIYGAINGATVAAMWPK